MTITPENIAKLIFHVSNLRYYEKEYGSDQVKDGKVESAIIRLRWEIDRLLNEAGFDEHFDLTTLTEIVRIYMESTKLKQAV